MSTTVVICGLLVFVPVGYIYPSRMLEFRTLTLSLSGLWLIAYAVVVAQLPDPSALVLAASGAYLVYYLGMSLHLETRRRAGREQAPVQVAVESVH